MSKTTETMRRHAFDYGIGSGAELEFIHDADRLAKLEDGIRALAGRFETEEDLTAFMSADDTANECARRLRALLDGE